MPIRHRHRGERRDRTETAVQRQLQILRARGRIAPQDRSQPHRFAKCHALHCSKRWLPYFSNPRRSNRVKGRGRLTVQERRAEQGRFLEHLCG